jgi:hypothetical protein
MVEQKTMVRWTNEERALLAHFMRIAIEENDKSSQEALQFAASKLGRSISACAWQYHTFITKGNYRPITVIDDAEEELFKTTESDELEKLANELAYSQELVRRLKETLDDIYDAVTTCGARNTWSLICILEDTGKITPEDLEYHNNLIDRIFRHKYFEE